MHEGIKAKDMDDFILALVAFDAGCSEFYTFDIKRRGKELRVSFSRLVSQANKCS